MYFVGTERERQAQRKTAVPSRFAWSKPRSSPDVKARAERVNRRDCKRRKLFHDVDVTQESVQFFASPIDSKDIGVGEEVIEFDELIPDYSNEKTSTSELTCATIETQTPKLPTFSLDNFVGDDAGIHYYAGLEEYSKLIFVLQTLGPAAYCLQYAYYQVTNISVPDQFFMVLMKVRWHMTNFELSRLFGVSESVVSNIFVTWIIFMSKQWREIKMWPDVELVRYFTPQGFKWSFPRIRVIIDGTECPVKKTKAAYIITGYFFHL